MHEIYYHARASEYFSVRNIRHFHGYYYSEKSDGAENNKKSGIFVERHAPGEAAESDQNIRPHGYFYLREQHAERNIEQTAEHLSVAGSRPHELSDKVYRGRDIVRRAGEHIESRSAENEHKSERGYCPGVDFYF